MREENATVGQLLEGGGHGISSRAPARPKSHIKQRTGSETKYTHTHTHTHIYIYICIYIIIYIYIYIG